LYLRDGDVCRNVALRVQPFLIGRDPESDLLLTHSFISRRQAEIAVEDNNFVIRDLGSRHGTYVNGQRITFHQLRPGDLIKFGSLNGPELQFGSDSHATHPQTSSTNLLEQLKAFQSERSDIEKLHWFLDAARELNSADAVDRVLASLLQTTIRLAGVERGFVFLADAAGELQLAAGMDLNGNEDQDASTISRTVMRQAINGREQFLITDTLTAGGIALPESIVAQQMRAIICIPLRRRPQRDRAEEGRSLLGALYLDTRFGPAQFTRVDHELLNTIAREAAALVENAQLAIIEENARNQAEELQFAARIQQALMTSQIPRPEFARVEAYSIACSEVGGDFYDVILKDNVLSVALVDVSGKGTSAAILASILQGMLYVQLEGGRKLAEIAGSVNDYLCKKAVGKYATMVLACLRPNGHLEYINCGHVPPRICVDEGVSVLSDANVPVGLFADGHFESASVQLQPGSRVLLVSDGFSEAADPCGNFFGDEGLDLAARCSEVQAMLDLVRSFCKGSPATDDCTLVQIEFLP
jgi:serine phosphatase RsbU (regulator of sigma subunit)